MGNNVKKLRAQLKKICATIVKYYNPQKIILFGSAATGKLNGRSDLDILIIKNTNKPFLQRLKEVAFMCNYEEPVDFLVYTEQEWKDMINSHNYFAEREIFKKGKVLYEK